MGRAIRIRTNIKRGPFIPSRPDLLEFWSDGPDINRNNLLPQRIWTWGLERKERESGGEWESGREMRAGKPREWIRCDESGREMVSRVLSERPFIVPVPPLHRVPLRLGNIVEISGPSNSAKSQVLVQVGQVTV